MKKLLMSSVLVLACILAACNTAQVVTTLTMVTTVLQTESPIVLANVGNLTPAQQVSVEGYLTQATNCTDNAVLETASTDISSVKYSKILGYCSSVVLPDLTGTPAVIAASLSAINVVIQAYLVSQVPVTPVAAVFRGVVKVQNISWHDRQKLNDLHKKLVVVSSTLVK